MEIDDKIPYFSQVLVDVHADPNLLVAYGNQPFLHFITSFLCISMGFFFPFQNLELNRQLSCVK